MANTEKTTAENAVKEKKSASKKSSSKKSTSKAPARKKEPKILRPQEESEIFALDIGTYNRRNNRSYVGEYILH